MKKKFARVAYLVAVAILATLPFDPILNHRFLVAPVGIVCVVVGLVSIYICTFPDKPQSHQKGGLS